VATEQSLAVFEAIVAHMAEGVIFLDHDDIIRICNPAVESIRSVKAARILGWHIFRLHPPPMHHRIHELLSSLKSGTFSSCIRVVRVQNRHFENSYSAIRGDSGEYLGTLLVSRDITEQKRLSEENLSLRHPRPAAENQPLVARSEAMKRVLEMIDAVAVLDSTVLVTGENGTGKERVVERIHRLSARRDEPLVRVNCAALPEALIESELFGHARGAFTGAVEDHKGKFALAHGGTLFLDEIGEMPLAAQAKVLRAIQEKSIQPVGGRREIRVDVRIVAASNRDLAREVGRGAFREDLFYRLNVIPIEVPPLRERREDIIPLAEAFVATFCAEMRRPQRRLSPQARAILLSHPFPGNVRQLKHAMERAVALGKGELILPDDLPVDLTALRAPAGGPAFVPEQPLREALHHFERDYLRQALDHFGRRKVETARALGISRKSLWEKIQRHDLDPLDVTVR
jgi:PAS domain S-box-containing protein